jgi:putative transposase
MVSRTLSFGDIKFNHRHEVCVVDCPHVLHDDILGQPQARPLGLRDLDNLVDDKVRTLQQRLVRRASVGNRQGPIDYAGDIPETGCKTSEHPRNMTDFHFQPPPSVPFKPWDAKAISVVVRLVRSLPFPSGGLPPALLGLLAEFRLIVNKSIRIALHEDIRSRVRLAKAAYQSLSDEHNVYKQYIPSAFEVALTVLKVYRRRMRTGKRTTVPFMRRLMLKAENQSYRFDRTTGRLRVPIRRGEHVDLDLHLSEWHRSLLSDPSWALGSLTVTPERIVVAMRKGSQGPYEPLAAIALDTNEDSLDGVVAEGERAHLVSLPFGGVRQVQATHFRRRRKLAGKKAQDRRMQRRLLAREGRRERNRVAQRLHRLSSGLVAAAEGKRAAIVLEDLSFQGTAGRSKKRNRRLSSWPRSEIHRQIQYKAALEGVPVIKVNPHWTSKTCPVCGARRRDRVGKVFVCLMCDWEMDRQINAGLNILKTALASNEALARAVRFQPGALRHDVVSPLYDLLRERGGAREEPSGVEYATGPA